MGYRYREVVFAGSLLLSAAAQAGTPLRPFVDATPVSTHVPSVQVGRSFTAPGARLTGLVRAGVVVPVVGPLFVQSDVGINLIGAATNNDYNAFDEGTGAQADVQLRVEPFAGAPFSPYLIGGYSAALVTPYSNCYRVDHAWSGQQDTCDQQDLISRGPSYGIGFVMAAWNQGDYSGYDGIMVQFTHFSGNHDVWSNSLSIGFIF